MPAAAGVISPSPQPVCPGDRHEDRFVGPAFLMSDDTDLQVYVKRLGAQWLSPHDLPDGGCGVELADPSGRSVWLLQQRQPVEPLPLRETVVPSSNTARARPRVNRTVRTPIEPARVARLGHVVLQTVDFPRMDKWNLVIDVGRCENCHNCVIAARDEHVGNDYPGYAAPASLASEAPIRILRRVQGQAPMPLTAVGKIFKPKLKHEETVDALRSALRAEGLVELRLEVLDDPRWGTRVEVLLPDRAGIDIARDVLGRFPFRFELSMPGKPGPRTP